MPSRSINLPGRSRNSLSLLATFVLLSSQGLPLGTAQAAAPTCQSLQDSCLSVASPSGQSAPTVDPDGIARPHISQNECYDNFHKGIDTGVWPQHLPFNFATPCTPN